MSLHYNQEKDRVLSKFDDLLDELSDLNAEYELKVNNVIQKLNLIAELRSMSIHELSNHINQRIKPLYDN